MGIYSSNYNESAQDFEIQDMDALGEAFIYDDLSKLSDADKKAFLESEDCALLEAKKLIGRKTLVRLSKNDDITRRTTMAAMQLAKERKDPLWEKLVKNRIKERQLLAAIRKKYGAKGQRVARQGQKAYLKGANSKFLTKNDISHRP